MGELKLGVKAMDKITGFAGVVTGHATYLDRSPTWLVEGHVTDPGKSPPSEWVAESRLEVIQ